MIYKFRCFICKLFFYSIISSIINSTILFIAQADIVTSIRPLAFIIAGVADGVSNIQILIPDGSSPHDYSLKLSDFKKIKQADLVVFIGPDMEFFLKNINKLLPAKKQLVLSEEINIKRLLLSSFSKKPEFNHISDYSNENHYKHHHSEYNMHIWLSPKIANIAAHNIYNRLIKIYPKQKQKLILNLYNFKKNITQNDKKITNILKSSKNKGYYVFHDAYNYFEKYYMLSPLGYFTINPEIQPGAKKLYEIKTQLIKNKVKCIFLEPQFKPNVINTISRNTKVNFGTLDPLGVGIEIRQDSYMKFLVKLSEQYASCLN
ncbi:High-affinity zinc uptake system protein ZnuA [Candidatus Providencia siddallii]|uniref:High-affinity zinc uptake system protein ZnuA n=1 Tax=Candidatus Providencia siddallii TaxID=1715285 RepID=A0A0M6W717_9GAMM|nr:High-affinity zinc uptake system protein ZnuA [Candidatus Providencia siddallii]